MMNVIMLTWMVQDRQENLRTEAKKSRRLNQSRPEDGGLLTQLMVHTGDFLIAAGQRLRNRYTVAAESAAKPCRSDC